MKKKIGTILDEDVFFAAKHMALLQKKSLSEFLEDAIRTYLRSHKSDTAVADQTKGVMRLAPGSLKKVMEEDSYLES